MYLLSIINSLLLDFSVHARELIKFTWVFFFCYYFFLRITRLEKENPVELLSFTLALLLVGSMPNNSSCQQKKPYQLLALNDCEPVWIAAVRN